MRFKEGDTVVFQGYNNWLDNGFFTVGKEYTVGHMGCVTCSDGGRVGLARTTDNSRLYNFKKVNK